jgi:simple sugar transport system permease protein
MSGVDVTILAATVIAGAAPIVLAALGETLTEKAGIINLSLDGSILLAAMAAFSVAYETGSLTAGCLAGAAVGAFVAGIVGLFSIYLGQNQVAVGFVLTLMARDLAYFLGNPYSRIHGPRAGAHPVPLLAEIPFLGEAVFSHTLFVYGSLLAILLCWFYVYKTPSGLRLRAVGEHPRAAYARGLSPRRLQMTYTLCGGLLVGLAGATFSLATKPGWGRPQGAEGTGWIALALVIFGGWHPVRAAAGAYLFSFLQVIGIHLQGWFPSVPAQVFQVAPFPLMIFTLLLMNRGQEKPPSALSAGWHRLLTVFSGRPPAALGRPYRPE